MVFEDVLVLGISGTELLIILFFGFLIFGPEKLPQMGRTVGRAIRQFREASDAANKKFKEEVADPFQEAVAPYKEQVEETTKPLQEDINAINETFSEAKNMITDPFKDMFKSESEEKKAAGAVIGGGIANDIVSEVTKTGSSDEKALSDDSQSPADEPGEDPFADVLDSPQEGTKTGHEEAKAVEGKPIPQSHGTVKKTLAASLYELDDAKDGE